MKPIHLLGSAVLAATTLFSNAQTGRFTNFTPDHSMRVGGIPVFNWTIENLPILDVEDIITINPNGIITTKVAQKFDIKHLIAAVYGSPSDLGAYRLVTSFVQVGSEWQQTFKGVIAEKPDGAAYLKDRNGNITKILQDKTGIVANANINISYSSIDAQTNVTYTTGVNEFNARVYKNGNRVPRNKGYNGQPSLKETPFLLEKGFIVDKVPTEYYSGSSEKKKVFSLNLRQVILVFDTTNAGSASLLDNTTGSPYDLNDYVAISTFQGESAKYTHLIKERDLKPNSPTILHLDVGISGNSNSMIVKPRPMSEFGSTFELVTRLL